MEFKIGALYKFDTEYFVVTGRNVETDSYCCTPTRFNKQVLPNYTSIEFHEKSEVATKSIFITDNKKVIDKFIKLL